MEYLFRSISTYQVPGLVSTWKILYISPLGRQFKIVRRPQRSKETSRNISMRSGIKRNFEIYLSLPLRDGGQR